MKYPMEQQLKDLQIALGVLQAQMVQSRDRVGALERHVAELEAKYAALQETKRQDTTGDRPQ